MEKFQSLYIKSLTEKLSLEEETVMNKWLQESEENRQWAEALSQSWTALEGYAPPVNVDTEAALDLFLSRIEQPVAKRRRLSTSTLLKWAAVGLVIVAVGLWLYLSPGSVSDIRHIAESDTPYETLILSDQSEITLSPGSVLEYPEAFDQSVRKVHLTGEALFDVTGNASRPFEIYTTEALIRVIGTSFNVRALDNEETVEVQVFSGIVEVVALNSGERVELRKNDLAILNIVSGQIQKIVDHSKNAISWKTEKLSFNNTPMKQVIRDIQKHYNIQIQIRNPQILNCTFTSPVPFVSEKVDVVLETLRRSFSMELAKKEGASYIYDGGSCKVD